MLSVRRIVQLCGYVLPLLDEVLVVAVKAVATLTIDFLLPLRAYLLPCWNKVSRFAGALSVFGAHLDL